MPNYRSWMILFAMLLPLNSFAATAPQKQTPETLIWTYTDFHELRTNAKIWHDVKGIDDFLFCFVNQRDGGAVRWDSGADRVTVLYRELPETVAALRKAGITANFVNANMDGDSFSWFDANQVQCIVDTFRAMARIAKQSGCRGVAIDTEP